MDTIQEKINVTIELAVSDSMGLPIFSEKEQTLVLARSFRKHRHALSVNR
jgi:hypothetical protein